MSLMTMMRATAAAGVLVAFVSLALFRDVRDFGVRFNQEGEFFLSVGVLALLALWLASPLPFAWIIARQLASTRPSQIAALAGMILALAAGIWLFHSAVSSGESLAGLVLLFAPAYQYGLLAFALAISALLRWRPGSRSS